MQGKVEFLGRRLKVVSALAVWGDMKVKNRFLKYTKMSCKLLLAGVGACWATGGGAMDISPRIRHVHGVAIQRENATHHLHLFVNAARRRT